MSTMGPEQIDPDTVEMLAAVAFTPDADGALGAFMRRCVDPFEIDGPTGQGPPTVSVEPLSVYVPGHGGVELATFLYGVDETAPRPAVWIHNRYNRGGSSRERELTWEAAYPGPRRDLPTEVLDLADPFLELVRRGYVVAVVDVRGTGSSFGTQGLPFSAEEAGDAIAVTRWLAAQPFCTGRVGMVGRSYMGATQFLAAQDDLQLGAVFPEMAPFDLYSTLYRGGIFREQFAAAWFADVKRRDRSDVASVIGGDAARLLRARKQHSDNRDLYALFSSLVHRDSVDPVSGVTPYATNSPGHDGSSARALRCPIHVVAGWFDPFVADATVAFANADVPKRLTIGPWAHSGSVGINLGREYVRWFDRWLRSGTDVADPGPAVRYYVVGAPPGQRWRGAEQWPPPGHPPARMHLLAGRSGTVDSCNDGCLSGAGAFGAADLRGGARAEWDEYSVDDRTSSGTSSRWTNLAGGPFGYGDMRANDERCLTYTSSPLLTAVEIVGHPVMSLWVSGEADDADTFVHLEQVASDGTSTYITEGSLRASHRAVSTPPFDNLGLPWHRSASADMLPLTGDPTLLLFDLSPVAWRLPTGSRVRVTVSCRDADNARPPGGASSSTVRVHRSTAHASSIDLPVREGVPMP